jgi:DNA repair protein RadD
LVLPTAAGKSYVQAMIVQWLLEWPHTRVLLITHRKTLIQQNYNKFLDLMNMSGDLFADVGIYSSGLKRRDTQNRIIFSGIQSVYKRAWELGFFDLIIVDEVHRIPISNRGTYRLFMDEMIQINPKIIITGLTATEYRRKSGMLCEGKDKLFDGVAYRVSIPELIDPNHFRNRDNEQYICTMISKNAVNQVDLKNVPIRADEYAREEMQKAFQADNLVVKAVREIKQLVSDRKKILVFTSGCEHCEEVTQELNDQGISATYIHSQQNSNVNTQNTIDFENGIYRALVNIDILTEGYDEPGIDCIVILRSTRSPGLFVQIVGRGFRLHPDKKDCLVLDFGGNILRFGPIDKIEVRKKKDGSGEVAVAPQKECPKCHMLLALAVMVCPTCGYDFPQSDKHEDTASEADILSKWIKPETMEVDNIWYHRHQKRGEPDSLRVDYNVGLMQNYSARICIEHEGFAKRKAMQWLKQRTDKQIDSVQDALDNQDYFKLVKQIIVNLNGKFPEITGYIFESDEEFKARLKALEQEKEDRENKMIEDILW